MEIDEQSLEKIGITSKQDRIFLLKKKGGT